MDKIFPPILTTERLLLRGVREDDAEDIFEYASDAETTRFMLWNAHKSIEETRKHILTVLQKYEEGNCYDYALVLKESNKLIGTGGIFNGSELPHFAEIGYIINKRYWGQGLVAEAMRAVVDYAFNVLNVHRISAIHFVDNPNSGRVMQKLGMVNEGISIDDHFVRGKYWSSVNYALINPNHAS